MTGSQVRVLFAAPIFAIVGVTPFRLTTRKRQGLTHERIQGTGFPGAAEDGAGSEAKNPQQVSRPARTRRSRGQGAAGRARSVLRPPCQGWRGARSRQGRSQAPRGRGRRRGCSPAGTRKAGGGREANSARSRAESRTRRALRRAEEEEKVDRGGDC